MADVFREVDEEVRQDRAKVMWRRYGWIAIAGAAGLLLGVAGFNFWQSYERSRTEAETAAIISALSIGGTDAAGGVDALAAAADGMAAGRATIARFHAAALLAEDGDHTGAADLYRAIAADTSVDALWRDLASLLGVMNALDTGDPETLAAELSGLTADDHPMRYSARELSGLVALRAGDTDAARATFDALAADDAAPIGIASRAAELASLLAESD